MKKKMLLVLATLTIFIMSWVVSPAVVTAADAWYSNCTIGLVGTGASGAYAGYMVFTMTCASPAVTNKTFTIPTDNSTGANRMMAVLLTAIGSDKQITAYVADNAPTVPNINILYLAN